MRGERCQPVSSSPDVTDPLGALPRDSLPSGVCFVCGLNTNVYASYFQPVKDEDFFLMVRVIYTTSQNKQKGGQQRKEHDHAQ